MTRLPVDRYANDRLQAVRSAKHQLEFILLNIVDLRKVDRQGKMEKAVNSFHGKLFGGHELTPAQYSYLDAIYERTMEGKGLGGVRTHHDPGPRR